MSTERNGLTPSHPKDKTKLILALRKTAERLTSGEYYNWCHQGACNCGHLAQSITNLSKAEIHAFALEKTGDWGEHAIDYCPSSGYPIDHILHSMLAVGLTPDDIVHFERLSSPVVLASIPPQHRNLNYRRREDVILYLNAWASILETEFAAATQISLPDTQLPYSDYHQMAAIGRH